MSNLVIVVVSLLVGAATAFAVSHLLARKKKGRGTVPTVAYVILIPCRHILTLHRLYPLHQPNLPTRVRELILSPSTTRASPFCPTPTPSQGPSACVPWMYFVASQSR